MEKWKFQKLYSCPIRSTIIRFTPLGIRITSCTPAIALKKTMKINNQKKLAKNMGKYWETYSEMGKGLVCVKTCVVEHSAVQFRSGSTTWNIPAKWANSSGLDIPGSQGSLSKLCNVLDPTDIRLSVCPYFCIHRFSKSLQRGWW